MLMADAGTIDFVLPVSIECACSIVRCAVFLEFLPSQTLVCRRVFAVIVLDEINVFRSVHHVQLLGNGAYRNRTIVRNLRLLTAAALLCGDDDDTVGTTRTVDGGSRCVLQHCEALDIVRIDKRERVVHTLSVIVIHRHAVDNNKRVVAGGKRSTATNTDLCTVSRSTGCRVDVHTGNLTLDHVLGRSDDTMIFLIRLEGCDRTGKVVLLSHTITDDHHFVKSLRVVP